MKPGLDIIDVFMIHIRVLTPYSIEKIDGLNELLIVFNDNMYKISCKICKKLHVINIFFIKWYHGAIFYLSLSL